MSYTAKNKFKLGERVYMTVRGMTHLRWSLRRANRHIAYCRGTVVGFGRGDFSVSVLHPGAKHPHSYYMGFWARDFRR